MISLPAADAVAREELTCGLNRRPLPVWILLTGATGYVGGRLLPALLARGEPVRCFARRPEAIQPRPGLEVVAGDALDGSAVRRALEGVDVAYYLIDAMGSPDGFEHLDRRTALIFAEAARETGVGRLVYLGGLGEGSQLSPHLSSRQEVGLVLASSGRRRRSSFAPRS